MYNCFYLQLNYLAKIDRDVEFILYHIYSMIPTSEKNMAKTEESKISHSESFCLINYQKLKYKIQYLEQKTLDLVRQLNYCIATENHASVSSLLLFRIEKIKSENLIQTNYLFIYFQK